MKYVVVGVERSSGEFIPKGEKETKKYDNIILHCFVIDNSVEPKKIVLVGNITESFKLANDFSNVITNGLLVEDFPELLGCQIYPLYDKYQKVEKVLVESIDGAI